MIICGVFCLVTCALGGQMWAFCKDYQVIEADALSHMYLKVALGIACIFCLIRGETQAAAGVRLA